MLTTPRDLTLGSTAPDSTLLMSSRAVTPVTCAAVLAELVLRADMLVICSLRREITACVTQHICSECRCVRVKNKTTALPPPGLAACSGQVPTSRRARAVCRAFCWRRGSVQLNPRTSSVLSVGPSGPGPSEGRRRPETRAGSGTGDAGGMLGGNAAASCLLPPAAPEIGFLRGAAHLQALLPALPFSVQSGAPWRPRPREALCRAGALLEAAAGRRCQREQSQRGTGRKQFGLVLFLSSFFFFF